MSAAKRPPRMMDVPKNSSTQRVMWALSAEPRARSHPHQRRPYVGGAWQFVSLLCGFHQLSQRWARPHWPSVTCLLCCGLCE